MTQPPVDDIPPELELEYTYEGVTYRLAETVAVELEHAMEAFFMRDAPDPCVDDQEPALSEAYFCDCQTCATREILVMTGAILLKAQRDGLAVIVDA